MSCIIMIVDCSAACWCSSMLKIKIIRHSLVQQSSKHPQVHIVVFDLHVHPICRTMHSHKKLYCNASANLQTKTNESIRFLISAWSSLQYSMYSSKTRGGVSNVFSTEPVGSGGSIKTWGLWGTMEGGGGKPQTPDKSTIEHCWSSQFH